MATSTRMSTLRLVGLLLLIHAILFAVFVRDRWILAALEDERRVLGETFGAELAAEVQGRADRWFAHYFLASGVAQSSFELFIPTQAERAKAGVAKGMEGAIFSWWEERLRVLWILVYHALHRTSAALTWLPYGVLVLMPFLFDGLMRRKIRQTNFDYTSPASHSLGVHLISVCALAFVLMLLAPIAISPLVVPAMLLLIAVTSGVLAANWQKRW